MVSHDTNRPKRLNSDEEIKPNELAKIIKNEKPAAGEEKLRDIEPTPENYRKFKGERRRAPWPRGLIWGVVGLITLFIVGSIASFFFVKSKLKASISNQINTLQAGVTDLKSFDPQSAAQEFSLVAAASNSGQIPSFENILGMFGSLFAGGQNAVSSFGDLATQLAALSNEAGSFNVGSDLVSQLSAVRNTLAAIDTDSKQLNGALTSFGGSSSSLASQNVYLPLTSQVEDAKSFLDVFIPWLASPVPHHVLVLFSNPSEMRPGGGFLGSYADVTIASGTIQNVAFHDIADADAAFTEKIIPPPQLQIEVKNFRPADTNWFFDFPTSASETMQFFNESASTTFDAVIAVTPQVASDLLQVTGPITISSTTFNSGNVLIQIQNMVQQGQAEQGSGEPSGTGQSTYPKAILGKLSQAIFAGLASSTANEPDVKQQLLSMALDWIGQRDAMIYFTNPILESFATTYGAAGDVYQLPQNFNGDYLAIADANINADKSELYIAQNVFFDAQIGADGTITDTLKITRTHDGNQSQYWWYQTTNQDYLQIFTPPGSALQNETGGIKKTLNLLMSAAGYARDGYSTDPLIAAIQSSTQPLLLYPAVATHIEDGKEVFATWTQVAEGKTTSLEFDYTHRAFIEPDAGVQYQFVFEKQPGEAASGDNTYDYEIDAPLGYVFVENGLATYEYQSTDPPGRLIVTLTLQKI